MKSQGFRNAGAALALGLILVLAACQNPMSGHGGSGGSGGGGSLTISVGDGVSRTLQPALDMNPASYQIDGEGPGGATFTRIITGSATVTVDKLAFGQWTITVTAFNADDTAIGAATSTATVHSNAGTTVALTVKPYDGFGTLSLDLSWPAADIETAQVESTLLPVVGAARTLTFDLNAGAGTADFSADDVSTGYHTLTVKLLDNGALTMGAVELVRIVKGQVTSGSFAFTNVNKPGGSIDVEITPDMGNPLDVSIAGAADTKPADETLNLTASNAQGVNATYAWYVNGEAKGTGSSFAFDDTWDEGYYRIDVIAISADGTSAGSANVEIAVIDSRVAAPQFTPPAGSYSSPQTVTITTSTLGATIRYTTDGSTPTTTHGNTYAVGISVESSTTIRAVAYKSGFADSIIVEETYRIAGYSIGGTGPAGGIVFYDKGSYSEGWRYLEAAPSDQISAVWAFPGDYGTVTGASGMVIGTGSSNTALIDGVLAAGSLAARICTDLTLGGHTDWFLPSKDELNQMYINKEFLGVFASDWYWSSSEYDPYNAWIQNFNSGDQIIDGKMSGYRVRAIRAF